MSFTPLGAPKAPVADSGVSLNLRYSGPNKQIGKVTVSLNKHAQDTYFGGPAAGKKFSVLIGSGAQRGMMMVKLGGELEAVRGAGERGATGVRIITDIWEGIAKSNQPATKVEVVEQSLDCIVIKLPGWGGGQVKLAEKESAKKPMRAGNAVKPTAQPIRESERAGDPKFGADANQPSDAPIPDDGIPLKDQCYANMPVGYTGSWGGKNYVSGVHVPKKPSGLPADRVKL